MIKYSSAPFRYYLYLVNNIFSDKDKNMRRVLETRWESVGMLMTKCHLFPWKFITFLFLFFRNDIEPFSFVFSPELAANDHRLSGTVNGLMVWIGIRCQSLVGWMSIKISGMDRKIQIPEKPFLYHRWVRITSLWCQSIDTRVRSSPNIPDIESYLLSMTNSIQIAL